MGRNIAKNINKNLSSKYSEKLLDHAKKSARDALKTVSNRVIQKTEEATCNLIRNKIVKNLHQKIIQTQIKKKYLEKDIYLQN